MEKEKMNMYELDLWVVTQKRKLNKFALDCFKKMSLLDKLKYGPFIFFCIFLEYKIRFKYWILGIKLE